MAFVLSRTNRDFNLFVYSRFLALYAQDSKFMGYGSGKVTYFQREKELGHNV